MENPTDLDWQRNPNYIYTVKNFTESVCDSKNIKIVNSKLPYHIQKK